MVRKKVITTHVVSDSITQPTDELSVYAIYRKYTHGVPVYGTPSPRVYDNNRDMIVNPLNHFGIDLLDIQSAVLEVDKIRSNIKKAQELAKKAQTDVVSPSNDSNG